VLQWQWQRRKRRQQQQQQQQFVDRRQRRTLEVTPMNYQQLVMLFMGV
jgi:hypothetical protein